MNRTFKRAYNLKNNNSHNNNSFCKDILKPFCNKKYTELPPNVKQHCYNLITNVLKKNNKPVYKLVENDMYKINSNYLLKVDIKNGIDFKLLLTRFNNKTYNIFIINGPNNRLFFYSVKFRFDNKLYNNTLFEGKLGNNEKKCWVYFINDIVYYMNNYTYEDNLSRKINLLSTILKNEYVYDDFLNPCFLQLGSYFTIDHMNFINKNCRLLFVSEYFNMCNFYVDIIFKNKEVKNKNTADRFFLVKKGDVQDVYLLYDNDIFVDIACINTLEKSLKMRQIFEDKNNVKLEFTYSKYFNKWVLKN